MFLFNLPPIESIAIVDYRHGNGYSVIKLLNSFAFRLLMVLLLATGIVFIWSINSLNTSDQQSDTWVDQSGHLHVLGIELGKSTLREAETALKSRSDTAIYIYPEGEARPGVRLEAYFPAIADHSKVILQLEASPTLLEKLQQRSTIPHLYPNKVARMNLHPEDQATVQQQIVMKATLIPSLHITSEMLKKRFGEPSTTSTAGDETTHYYYQAIGLHAIISKDDVARLQFSNPTLNHQ